MGHSEAEDEGGLTPVKDGSKAALRFIRSALLFSNASAVYFCRERPGGAGLGEMIMKENVFKQIEWLFFDVGTTLVDESRAKEHRILDAIEGTDISYEQIYAQAVQLAKQGKTIISSLN